MCSHCHWVAHAVRHVGWLQHKIFFHFTFVFAFLSMLEDYDEDKSNSRALQGCLPFFPSLHLYYQCLCGPSIWTVQGRKPSGVSPNPKAYAKA